MERILPTDLLRTLLVLARTRSFSRTGEEIGRSQSAVSLQMQRLQHIVGSPILTTSGKSFGLTPQGEIVLEYAKQMVALNDECVGRLDGGILTGTIRVGIPSDFALSFLPRLLGRFSESNLDIALDVTCELSRDLIARLVRNEFDIVLAVHDDTPTAPLTDLWREPMAWVGSQTHDVRAKRPLPLVLFPDGCQYRLRVLSALRRRDIPYKIVYSSSNLAGNQAAIESGLGLTAISTSTVPPTLRALPDLRGTARARRLRYRALLEPQWRDRCHTRPGGGHGSGAGRQAHADRGAHTEFSGPWCRRAALAGPAGRAQARYYFRAATASSRRSRSNGKGTLNSAVRRAVVVDPDRAPLVRRDPRRGRVGGVVTEPRPSQTRACAFTHSVLRMSVSLTARRLIA